MEGSSSQRISVEVAGLASHIAAAIPPSHHTDALQTRRADISLSPSARTSYTRVDLSAADNGRREEEEDVADVENAEEDVDDEPEAPHTMPQVSLTFLLVSGRRRTMSFDQEITVGRVKELVWNAWPNEWQDERPPAPSYLRILYLGKILQDDDNLTKIGFPSFSPSLGQEQGPSTPPSTIVHLSIRSYAPPGADDSVKKKGRRRMSRDGEGGEDLSGGGLCCSCLIC